jgi:hypothetical protein
MAPQGANNLIAIDAASDPLVGMQVGRLGPQQLWPPHLQPLNYISCIIFVICLQQNSQDKTDVCSCSRKIALKPDEPATDRHLKHMIEKNKITTMLPILGPYCGHAISKPMLYEKSRTM